MRWLLIGQINALRNQKVQRAWFLVTALSTATYRAEVFKRNLLLGLASTMLRAYEQYDQLADTRIDQIFRSRAYYTPRRHRSATGQWLTIDT